MKFGIPTGNSARLSKRAGNSGRGVRCSSAFTLAEVLAALLFMAIVIPVAVEALGLASRAGETGVRKNEAMRVADRVLNESIVMTNWDSAANGTVIEGTHEYRWTLKNEMWPTDSSMRLVTAEVTYSVAGRNQSVRLNTLANATTLGSSTTGQ